MSVVKAISDASSASSRGLVSRLMLLLMSDENCGEFHSDAPKKADPVRSVICLDRLRDTGPRGSQLSDERIVGYAASDFDCRLPAA